MPRAGVAGLEIMGVRFDVRAGSARQQWVPLPPEAAGRGLRVTASAPPADALRAQVVLHLELVSPTERRTLPVMRLPVWDLAPAAALAPPVTDPAG